MENQQSVSELYKVIRAQVEHVDNNLGQRVIWLVIAQSFFFGALATLINGKPPDPKFAPIHQLLVHVLPIAALLTVVFTFVDVVTSLLYMHSLRKKYEASMGDNAEADNSYPSITGSNLQRTFMHTSPILIPLMFIIIWIIFLVIFYTKTT